MCTGRAQPRPGLAALSRTSQSSPGGDALILGDSLRRRSWGWWVSATPAHRLLVHEQPDHAMAAAGLHRQPHRRRGPHPWTPSPGKGRQLSVRDPARAHERRHLRQRADEANITGLGAVFVDAISTALVGGAAERLRLHRLHLGGAACMLLLPCSSVAAVASAVSALYVWLPDAMAGFHARLGAHPRSDSAAHCGHLPTKSVVVFYTHHSTVLNIVALQGRSPRLRG